MTAEHPDALLSKARRGALSDDESAALDAHLRACPACALERAFVDDLDASPADPAWMDRAVGGALDQLAAAPVMRLPSRASRVAWLVAAAVALVALAATAAAVVWRRPRPAARAPARTHVPTVAPVARASEAPRTPEAPAPVPSPAPPTERVRVASAAELYRRANDARHAQNDRDAVRRYGDLLRAHPASREAAQAEVSLARLLLDRGEDLPRAAALFEGHLRGHPGAPDEEGVMAGLARVYQRLGRRDDERRAWEALLARHPGSLHADAAHARLAALR